MVAFKLTLKSFRFRWQRYALMAGALSFCFAAILLLTGLAAGMANNVHEAALPRYGGDLFILGHQKMPYYTPVIRDTGALLAAVKAAGIDATLIARRTDYYENGLVFFNGYAAPQKVVSGIDWRVESRTFSGLKFSSGGYEGMAGSDGILISTVTAKELQARVGDNVVLEADTVTGQRNTVTLIVKGIFNDSSIFGAYTSYVDLSHLNRLIGLKPDEYSILGIYLRHPQNAAADAARLYAALSKSVPMFRPVKTEQELWTRLAGQWIGVKYAVLTLNGYLSEIGDLTSAVNLGLWLLLLMMLTIVLIGIANTYSVIIHDRTREFGTLRALGMQQGGIARLIFSETLFLGLFGIVVGGLLGLAGLVVVGNLNVPYIPGFDIFLKKGRLGWAISLLPFLLESASVVAAVLIGGMIPARRASAQEPAKALRIVA